MLSAIKKCIVFVFFPNIHRYFVLGKKLKCRSSRLGGCFYRIMRHRFMCDIPLTQNISDKAYFNHNGFGIVINPNAIIEDNVNIQHSVTIGANYRKEIGGGITYRKIMI